MSTPRVEGNKPMAGEVVTSIVGGVGNQLYCWATAAAVARKAGLELVLELSSYERDPYGRTYMLSKLGITDARTSAYNRMERAALSVLTRVADRRQGHFSVAGRSVYTDPGGVLNRTVLESQLSGRCSLRGYWQSPRYFADYASQIREAVKFKPCRAVDAPADAVCVHVRSFKEAPAATIGSLRNDYYQAAYARCYQRFANPKFVVYSDDLQWAKENAMLPATYEACGQMHASSCAEHDLCELVSMSRFQNYVIANSSFSWWAAYLSDHAPWVLAPGRNRHAWFSEEPLPAEWDEV